MIELHGVTRRFGTTMAVRNLSFSAKEREFIVIFGPAGAGKSTTLRLIAGITAPTYGEILFRGSSLEGVPPEKRNFSMVFENYALYSHLTVFENLAFPLRARRLPEAEIGQRVHKMAEILHISPMLDRKPGYLSGGQRQRVALGRGLIREADIYLLDEPISHLDARLRIQMRAELKNICLEKQSTVIHVTHDYREAMALADRVIVLNKGRLMQEGAPEEVYHNPANDFVARFVGDPPMSFVQADFTLRNGSSGFKIKGQELFIQAADDLTDLGRETVANCEDLRLGLRANQTSLSSTYDEHHRIPVEIYLAEAQGHRNLITVEVGDPQAGARQAGARQAGARQGGAPQNLVQVVTSPDQVWRVGEQAWMSMETDFLHVFADGKAVYHPKQRVDSPVIS